MNLKESLRQKPKRSPFKKSDVLVLFGELFQRGYANGLVEEAEKIGMEIIYSTVGRRDREGNLRPLQNEEIQHSSPHFINIPLEAGFDYEKNSAGLSVIDYLKDVKLSDWESWKKPAELNVQELIQQGRNRFRKQVKNYVAELEPKIKSGQNIIFAHLMAGGVPRAKIIMPLMNRAFKGTQDRYLSSEKFWSSEIGKICQQSFLEVTAETFQILIEETAELRRKVQSSGGQVSYTAYGYHGTEIFIQDKIQWQTYTPYLQGWAKMRLEDIAKKFFDDEIACCVYNCPEILTNSSSIFQGVEVSLYPLLYALKKFGYPSEKVQNLFQHVQNLLHNPQDIDRIQQITDAYFSSDLIRQHCQFEKWPQQSSPEQMEMMINTSEELIALHKDPKQLLTAPLSEIVFEACGYSMLHTCYAPTEPVIWLNHDLVADHFHS